VPQTDRTPEQIQRDIAAERERLTAIFEELGNEVDDLVKELQQQVTDAGKKALIIGPALGAVTAGLVLARRRRKRRKARKAGLDDED
jgi:orotate phosphoribosyltransferase